VDNRQFLKLFEYISNLEKRYAHPFKLIVISFETGADELPNTEKLERAMFYMERSIRQTIRNVDVLTRCSRWQFLVILLGTDLDGVKIAIDRIFRGYYKMIGSDAFTPAYTVADLSGKG
jgi:hypothetical protein